MIAVSEEIDTAPFENFSFVGELALDGQFGRSKACCRSRWKHADAGSSALFVPEANAREAAMVNRIDIYGVQNLRQTFEFLRGEQPLQPTRGDLERIFSRRIRITTSISAT